MIRSVRLKHHLLRPPSQKVPQNTILLFRCFSNVPSKQSSHELVSNDSIYEKALYNPINFDTSSSIQGEESQILQVHLKPSQVLRAESGAMLFMTQGVEMSTGLGSKDGSSSTASALSDGLKRMLTGQNMFLSDYTYHGEPNTVGTLALGTDFPSKILRLSLSEYDGKIVAQKGAYLASSIDVDIQIEFTKKFTAGFFGGEGFILQSLIGNGDVFVKAGGTLVKKQLSEGETLRISSGSLVAMTKDVAFDVTTMPGFKNVLFGGEGLFVTTLTGPGTVWLQGMPADRMISEIARRIPSGGGIGIPIGMGSGSSSDGSDSTGVETPGSAGEAAVGEENAEDLVASTDAAIDADRNATVATSGIATDSESTSALFGDAAPKDEGTLPKDSDGIPGLDIEDTTSFSTQNDNFGEDFTKDQEFDDFANDETSFTTMDDEKFSSGSDDVDIPDELSDAVEESTSSLGSLFSNIWDMFRDDD